MLVSGTLAYPCPHSFLTAAQIVRMAGESTGERVTHAKVHLVGVACTKECSGEEAKPQSNVAKPGNAWRKAVDVAKEICAGRQDAIHGKGSRHVLGKVVNIR